MISMRGAQAKDRAAPAPQILMGFNSTSPVQHRPAACADARPWRRKWHSRQPGQWPKSRPRPFRLRLGILDDVNFDGRRLVDAQNLVRAETALSNGRPAVFAAAAASFAPTTLMSRPLYLATAVGLLMKASRPAAVAGCFS